MPERDQTEEMQALGLRRAGTLRRTIIRLALTLGVFTAVHAMSLDGLDGLLLRAMFGDGSEWSASYSALGFWRVRRGMTAAEVLALAGEPIDRYDIQHTPGLTGWRWTRNPHDTHYRVRVILFQNGKVVEKHAEFHVD